MTTVKVSVVATVLNEYGSLPGWLAALASQSRLPDECVIVDGGSTDGAVEFLQSVASPFPLTLVVARGCNISEGRNIAIERSAGELIAVTDAGTRADPEWLERIAQPLLDDPSIDLVAGFFEAEARGLWMEALAAATLPDADEIDRRAFLASSRSVAFRRRWWERGFDYPEWLDYCEDVVFDLRLRRASVRQHTEPVAIVRLQPRRSVESFFRQYFRYARGDGKAGLFFRRHLVRYCAYAMAIVVLVRHRPVELGVASLVGAIHLRRSVQRLLKRRRTGATSSRLALRVGLAALQIAVGDIAKMAGYPAGLIWRWQRDRSLRFWKSGWRSRGPDGRLRRP